MRFAPISRYTSQCRAVESANTHQRVVWLVRVAKAWDSVQLATARETGRLERQVRGLGGTVQYGRWMTGRPSRLIIRLVACLIGSGAAAGAAAAQLPNQAFEVTPAVAHAGVGDTISVRFRVRLDQTDLLFDTVPRPTGELPQGVRVLSVERLQRQPDRTWTGRAVVAFFRPGRQAVPVFGLPFMRGVKGLSRGTLASDSAFVEIDPVAPPGNPSLKDIRDIVGEGLPDWRPVAGMLAAAALGALAVRRLRRHSHDRSAGVPSEPGAPMVLLNGPYESALARLAEIERDAWIARGDVARHYAGVADTLRQYLEDARGVRALSATTSEILALVPLARDGTSGRGPALFHDADLVKFARARPDPDTAARFIRDARVLLDEWHAG